MYERFFGLRQPPFATSPELQQLFFAETHREALARLVYGILARKPLIILTGDVGLGKSTMLRAALARATSHQALRVVSLPHPLLRPGDVLRIIARELDMPNAQQLRVSDLDAVHEAMKKLVADGQRLALVIDEAQSLPAETLEFVRLMSNLETGLSGNFQIVLVGQPELWEMLQGSEFRHLRQRIAIRAELQPLSKVEAGEYLRHRLKQAGAGIEQIFTKPAVAALIREGHGAPRRLNCIADNALLLAFGDQKKPVDLKHVEIAAETQDKVSNGVFKWRRWFRKPLLWITAPVLAATVFVTLAVILFPPRPAPKMNAAPRIEKPAVAGSAPASAPVEAPQPVAPVPASAPSPPPTSASPLPASAVRDSWPSTRASSITQDVPPQTEAAAAATLPSQEPVTGRPAATTPSRQRITQ